MPSSPVSRSTGNVIGLVALAGGLGWLRLLLGAVPERGTSKAVQGLIGFDSIYSAWAFIPLLWTTGLFLVALVLLAGPHAARLPASTIVAAALVHLASWAGFGWYHHGRFVGSTSSHAFVDPPSVALLGSISSLLAGCAVTAAVLPSAISSTGACRRRVRRGLVFGGTYALLIIGVAVAVGDPVTLYLIPLMGLPWTAMLVISAWLVRPASLTLIAAVLASSAAVLPVAFDLGDPRDAALEFIFLVAMPFGALAWAAFELFTGRRLAPNLNDRAAAL